MLGDVFSSPLMPGKLYIGTVTKREVDLEDRVVVLVVGVVDLGGDVEVEEDVARSYLQMILMLI